MNPELDLMRVNIRRARRHSQKSLSEVAERAGLSLAGYRNIESGFACPRVSTLLRIAKVLRVSVADLFQVAGSYPGEKGLPDE